MTVVTGAILAGGQSRRMGRDKALIQWDANVTLLDRVIDALRQLPDVIAEVIIVGDRPDYHGHGARVVADHYPGAGALGGIATALEVATHERAFVVACDMPLLSEHVIRRLIEFPTSADVVVPALPAARSDQGGGQTYETLHAIYRRTCLDPIRRRLQAGDLKVTGFFDEVMVEGLDERWVREVDPTLESFTNVNSPEELERARDTWARMRSR